MKTRSSFTLPAVLTALIFVLAGCGGPNLFERMGGGFWGYGICGTIILILDVIALIEVAGANWTLGRKALWALLIVFFPVGGLVLYWMFGK